MSSNAKNLKQSKPNLKARKGHETVTPDTHTKWAEFIEQVRKELGWTLDQTCDLTDMKMGWLKKARRGQDIDGGFREKFENAINKRWHEKFPDKTLLTWPAWIDGASWSERNSIASPPSAPAEEKIRHNLPETPACFFGHKKLRRKVASKLIQNGLIVLHETGGMGKTTFAKQVAHDAIQKNVLPGGAVWLNFEPNPTIEQCQRTMTEVLLGNRMENRSIADCVKYLNDYFSQRHTLVVFDNFETVLSKGEFNAFLIEQAANTCVLLTTREIHDGMKLHVQTLGKLDREDAIQLFLYEAGLKNISGEDRSIVWHLCESVGDIPLAVLLLARQAPKTTLSELTTEFQKNTNLLATDDGFLDARHRSMEACFLTSFARLNAEDLDSLFRFSVAPHGLGKQFAAAYLDKSNWLFSLTTCLHSALLKLEGNRYILHPLLKSFLHNQMGSRKGDWECCFVDFFCSLMNEAMQNPSDQAAPNFLHQERENCEAALWAAASSNRYQYLVLVLELLPQAWHSLGKLPLSEEGFDFREGNSVFRVGFGGGSLQK